jgi:general stress protein YciG
MDQKKQTKQQAGRKGGLATVARHGSEHMRAIGRRGAATFWKRYAMHPAGLSDFAIVKRENNEVIAFTSGRPEQWR